MATSEEFQTPLDNYLQELSMEQHTETLRRNGFTSLRTLRTATVADLEALGLLKGHAVYIVRALPEEYDAPRERTIGRVGNERRSESFRRGTTPAETPLISDDYALKVWGVDFFNEGAKVNSRFTDVHLVYATAGSYMLKKAMDDDDDDIGTTHAARMKARLGSLKGQHVMGWPPNLSVDESCDLWNRRCQWFYDTYGQASLKTKAKALKRFLLFLSKVCSHNEKTWHLEKEVDRNEWNHLQERWEKWTERHRVKHGTYGPGPLDEHVYLPSDWMEKAFAKTYKKHTTKGQEEFKDEDGIGDRKEKQQFLDDLVDRLEFKGVGRGYAHRAANWHWQFKQEIFYRLFKDAVIATLRSGATCIENYFIKGTHHFSIIANFWQFVGVDSNRMPTPFYRLVFKPEGENNPLGDEFPIFTGMYPVGLDELRGQLVWNLPFDSDNQQWKQMYQS